MSEEILQRDGRGRPGRWSVVLLRYFNPIGAHESGRIGERSQRRAQQPDALHHPGGRGHAGRSSASSATTIPPRTAPASGTTSMWWIWPRAMWRRMELRRCTTPARRCSIWAPARAPASLELVHDLRAAPTASTVPLRLCGPPGGRSGRILCQCRQGQARAGLAGRAEHRRHVPGQLELAEEQSERLFK